MKSLKPQNITAIQPSISIDESIGTHSDKAMNLNGANHTTDDDEEKISTVYKKNDQRVFSKNI